MTYKCPRCDLPLEWGDEPDGCRDLLCPIYPGYWEHVEPEEDDENE